MSRGAPRRTAALGALLASLLPWAALGGEAEGSAAALPPRPKVETSVLPGVNFDSDLGLGFGLVADASRPDPRVEPYRFRLAAQVWLYVKPGATGAPEVTYQHHYVKLDLPGLLGGPLRLNLVGRFRRESTAGWYGLGNDSEHRKPWEAIDRELRPEAYAEARRFNLYDRIYPQLQAIARLALRDGFALFGSADLTMNWVDVYPGSRLEQDLLPSAPVEVRRRLHGVGTHLGLAGTVGLLLDRRDDEVHPSRGTLSDVSVRVGGGFGESFAYGGVNATVRLFAPLLRDRLVLAGRVTADATFGRVPVYELTNAGGLFPVFSATGGAFSWRGVPAQRYAGKIKLLGNLELRARIVKIRLFKRPLWIGALGFVDTGRVFTDWRPLPELDGDGPGLKLGAGGGLRLQWGRTFMARLDAAGSPDGWGVYFDVDHVF